MSQRRTSSAFKLLSSGSPHSVPRYLVPTMGAHFTTAANSCFCRFSTPLQGPQTIKVTVVSATNLKQTNVLSDSPYVTVSVVKKDAKETATDIARGFKAYGETKPIQGDLSPEWNEELVLDGWFGDDDLVFKVLDKGLVGSKMEAKLTLTSKEFYPLSFNGYLTIDSFLSSYLYVKVEYAGPTVKA
mmetsp:Transcript_83326/g.147574  ORF Transcript_83326/g.147574 Transcript_83326/m.147574 type:complete len:186 (+) Transcript_83326:3-560(+)